MKVPGPTYLNRFEVLYIFLQIKYHIFTFNLNIKILVSDFQNVASVERVVAISG